jgi:signal transduction histidine kinase
MSVRLRVTLAFTGVMALVLVAAGLFLYLRLGAELDAGIRHTLQSRSADITALVARSGRLSESGRDAVAQVLDPSGRVTDATSEAGSRAWLSPAETRRAERGPLTVDHQHGDDHLRLLAAPARGGAVVVVVGEDLDPRAAAVSSLGTLLLIGGPILLLLAALAGYGATAAALRPVERMRARAAEIEATDPGARLPVPAADDEIGRLGTTLNAMLERMEAAFARERTFVADASHELRTPLAILKTELELALRRGRTREELTAALRSAAEETDRLVALAEDLLVIARSDQGQLPIRPDDVAAAELLEGVRERFARRIAERDATVEVDANGLRFEADPLRVQQALGNMLDNALRYGGAHVELAAESRDGAVRLHVRDDGPGLPADLAAFERFTRGDGARGRGGSGLGLAIVAAIARAHGGEAGAADRPGGGADVWIELPCAS